MFTDYEALLQANEDLQNEKRVLAKQVEEGNRKCEAVERNGEAQIQRWKEIAEAKDHELEDTNRKMRALKERYAKEVTDLKKWKSLSSPTRLQSGPTSPRSPNHDPSSPFDTAEVVLKGQLDAAQRALEDEQKAHKATLQKQQQLVSGLNGQAGRAQNAEIAALKTELDEARAKNVELQGVIENQSQVVNHIQEELENTQKMVDGQLQEKEGEAAELKEKMKEKEDQITELNEKTKKLEDEVATATSSYQALLEQIAQSESLRTQKEAQQNEALKVREDECKKKEEELQVRESALDQNQDHTRAKEEELKARKAALETKEEELQKIQEEIKAIKANEMARLAKVEDEDRELAKDEDKDRELAKDEDEDRELAKDEDEDRELAKDEDEDRELAKDEDEVRELAKDEDEDIELAKDDDAKRDRDRDRDRDRVTKEEDELRVLAIEDKLQGEMNRIKVREDAMLAREQNLMKMQEENASRLEAVLRAREASIEKNEAELREREKEMQHRERIMERKEKDMLQKQEDEMRSTSAALAPIQTQPTQSEDRRWKEWEMRMAESDARHKALADRLQQQSEIQCNLQSHLLDLYRSSNVHLNAIARHHYDGPPHARDHYDGPPHTKDHYDEPPHQYRHEPSQEDTQAGARVLEMARHPISAQRGPPPISSAIVPSPRAMGEAAAAKVLKRKTSSEEEVQERAHKMPKVDATKKSTPIASVSLAPSYPPARAAPAPAPATALARVPGPSLQSTVAPPTVPSTSQPRPSMMTFTPSPNSASPAKPRPKPRPKTSKHPPSASQSTATASPSNIPKPSSTSQPPATKTHTTTRKPATPTSQPTPTSTSTPASQGSQGVRSWRSSSSTSAPKPASAAETTGPSHPHLPGRFPTEPSCKHISRALSLYNAQSSTKCIDPNYLVTFLLGSIKDEDGSDAKAVLVKGFCTYLKGSECLATGNSKERMLQVGDAIQRTAPDMCERMLESFFMGLTMLSHKKGGAAVTAKLKSQSLAFLSFVVAFGVHSGSHNMLSVLTFEVFRILAAAMATIEIQESADRLFHMLGKIASMEPKAFKKEGSLLSLIYQVGLCKIHEDWLDASSPASESEPDSSPASMNPHFESLMHALNWDTKLKTVSMDIITDKSIRRIMGCPNWEDTSQVELAMEAVRVLDLVIAIQGLEWSWKSFITENPKLTQKLQEANRDLVEYAKARTSNDSNGGSCLDVPNAIQSFYVGMLVVFCREMGAYASDYQTKCISVFTTKWFTLILSNAPMYALSAQIEAIRGLLYTCNQNSDPNQEPCTTIVKWYREHMNMKEKKYLPKTGPSVHAIPQDLIATLQAIDGACTARI